MSKRPEIIRRAYNVREFCAEFGFSRDGVYEAIREGALDARKFGKRTVITADAADAFLKSLPRLDLSKTQPKLGQVEHP